MHSKYSEYIPAHYRKDIVVLCCGNKLMGDDGFGCEVAERLQKFYKIPDNVCIVDIGTGIREYLIDLTMCDKKPKKLVVVDTINLADKKAGEIFEINAAELNQDTGSSTICVSTHEAPTIELLKQFYKNNKIDTTILLCQIDAQKTLRIGLSKNVLNAVDKMCKIVSITVRKKNRSTCTIS